MIFELNAFCGQLKRMQETQFQDGQRLNRILNGQRIVLIGGTSGFGFATAKAAAREGASIIVASSSKAKVDKPSLNCRPAQ
jgi:NADPH:quinone reductase-like Zn-dependent oxidoreductase